MGADKFWHFVFGALIMLALWPYAGAWAVLAVLVAAGCKELFDNSKRRDPTTGQYRKRGTPELLDALATVAGGALILAGLLLFTGCVRTERHDVGTVRGTFAGQPVELEWDRDGESSSRVSVPPINTGNPLIDTAIAVFAAYVGGRGTAKVADWATKKLAKKPS